ncbi:hypothetical protein GQR58_019112 [Nymphon striatum]|nr:hypothetical protein GQR58_019112 [Nymphon striatum]
MRNFQVISALNINSSSSRYLYTLAATFLSAFETCVIDSLTCLLITCYIWSALISKIVVFKMSLKILNELEKNSKNQELLFDIWVNLHFSVNQTVHPSNFPSLGQIFGRIETSATLKTGSPFPILTSITQLLQTFCNLEIAHGKNDISHMLQFLENKSLIFKTGQISHFRSYLLQKASDFLCMSVTYALGLIKKVQFCVVHILSKLNYTLIFPVFTLAIFPHLPHGEEKVALDMFQYIFSCKRVEYFSILYLCVHSTCHSCANSVSDWLSPLPIANEIQRIICCWNEADSPTMACSSNREALHSVGWKRPPACHKPIKALRMIWNVSPMTHCKVMALLSDSIPLDLSLKKRFCAFVSGIEKLDVLTCVKQVIDVDNPCPITGLSGQYKMINSIRDLYNKVRFSSVKCISYILLTPVNNYLYPYETDVEVLQCYLEALATGLFKTTSKSLFLYLLCIHHLHHFMKRSRNQLNKDEMSLYDEAWKLDHKYHDCRGNRNKFDQTNLESIDIFLLRQSKVDKSHLLSDRGGFSTFIYRSPRMFIGESTYKTLRFITKNKIQSDKTRKDRISPGPFSQPVGASAFKKLKFQKIIFVFIPKFNPRGNED